MRLIENLGHSGRFTEGLLLRRSQSDGQTILIVEDNELNMKLFRELLAAHGYVTMETNDGAEAVEAVEAALR